MLRALHSRIAVAFFALLLLAGAVWLGSTMVTTGLYQQEVEQSLNWDLARRLVEDQREALMTEDGGISPTGLKDLFHWLMVVNPSVEFYLIDAEGEIVAFDAPPGVVKAQRVSLEPVYEALSADAAMGIVGDDPRNPGQRKIFSVAPLPPEADPLAGDRPAGYLYIVLASQLAESAADRFRVSWVLRQAAWIALACLVLAGLAGSLLSRRLTRPLRALAERMRSFRPAEPAQDPGAANPEERRSRHSDEVAALETRFRELEARIEDQDAERQRLEILRRDLIANVSHDLRTPLAALRGYLETLNLKGDAVPEQRREEYLGIALRQAERLSRLVTELFELTKLESAEAKIDPEPFSIAELVQDNLQRFELPARNRGVELTAELHSRMPRVEADLGMVERVLENLLDNALRHTSEGGRVVVGLEPKGDRVWVRVGDNGEGIAHSDLPHVFDRYFRSASDTTEITQGVGLGLAISRRIAELHGSPLEVRSAAGQGAEFSFSLAVASRGGAGLEAVTET